MNPQDAIDLAREAIQTTCLVGGPILGLVLVIGLLISLIQALTQLHDPTISFVPKILLLLVALGLGLPWLSETMTDYTTSVLSQPMWLQGSPLLAIQEETKTPSHLHQVLFQKEASEGSNKPLHDIRPTEAPATNQPTNTEAPANLNSPFSLPSYQYVPSKKRQNLEG